MNILNDESKPLIIYLDQNKWIDLARAHHNRSNGNQYKSILQKVMEAIESKKAIFPLSAVHLAETQKNSNTLRRKRLAKVMATISQSWSILLDEIIMTTGIQISAAKLFGFTPPQMPNVFGHGIHFALGIDLHQLMTRVSNDPFATSDNFLHLFETFTSTPQMTEYFLSGIGNKESELIDVKRKYEESLSKFADATEKFRAQLKSDFHSESSHRNLYIANLLIVIGELINRVLSVYGKTLDDIISMGEGVLVDFIGSVPNLDVETELVLRRNVNWNRKIDKNDLADISVLSITIPYCDIVVTENIWKDLTVRSGLDKKYNTVVLSTINELKEHL